MTSVRLLQSMLNLEKENVPLARCMNTSHVLLVVVQCMEIRRSSQNAAKVVEVENSTDNILEETVFPRQHPLLKKEIVILNPALISQLGHYVWVQQVRKPSALT